MKRPLAGECKMLFLNGNRFLTINSTSHLSGPPISLVLLLLLQILSGWLYCMAHCLSCRGLYHRQKNHCFSVLQDILKVLPSTTRTGSVWFLTITVLRALSSLLVSRLARTSRTTRHITVRALAMCQCRMSGKQSGCDQIAGFKI